MHPILHVGEGFEDILIVCDFQRRETLLGEAQGKVMAQCLWSTGSAFISSMLHGKLTGRDMVRPFFMGLVGTHACRTYDVPSSLLPFMGKDLACSDAAISVEDATNLKRVDSN